MFALCLHLCALRFVGYALRLCWNSIAFLLRVRWYCVPIAFACSSLLKMIRAHCCIQSFPITIHQVWQMMDKYVAWVFKAQTCTICATYQQKLTSVSSCLYNIQLASFN